MPLDVTQLRPQQLRELPNEQFKSAGSQLYQLYEADRRDSQLLYYRPVSPVALQIHQSTESRIGVGGGNGSSKTETCLVDLLIDALGVIPDSLRDVGIDWEPRLARGPINTRIIVESITTTLEDIILPKLQWWNWTGVDPPGGVRGHYGWIPKWCLPGGSWEKAWSAKLRTLTVLRRDPNNLDKVLGESKIQFMSHSQDPQDFASGDFQRVLMDEPPRFRIYTENEARVMRADGRIYLAMTWPDDPSIPVDWIFDHLFEPGQPGEGKDPDIVWINLYTTDNPYLNQESIAKQAEKWSPEMRSVRLEGKPLRFSNLIHPLFTDHDDWWCYSCQVRTFVKEDEEHLPRCATCFSADTTVYNHVSVFDLDPGWPVVMVLDPHPRKPHMMSFFQVTPWDDLWQFDELDVDDSPDVVFEEVRALEERYGFICALRLIDPNMGRSPASAQKRQQTWQDEFAAEGLTTELANDSNTGLQTINAYLKPDDRTRSPRILIHKRCTKTIAQLKRFMWDEWKGAKDDKDVKQKPRAKNDDYPTNLKYIVNQDVAFEVLRRGPEIIRRLPGASPKGRRQGMRETRPEVATRTPRRQSNGRT